MTVALTLTLGDILQVIVVLLGGLGVYFKLSNNVTTALENIRDIKRVLEKREEDGSRIAVLEARVTAIEQRQFDIRKTTT